MEYAQAKDELIEKLSNESCKVIALSGGWGTGKTYLWEQVKKTPTPLVQRAVYKSLLGVRDMATFKLELANAVGDENKRCTYALGTFFLVYVVLAGCGCLDGFVSIFALFVLSLGSATYAPLESYGGGHSFGSFFNGVFAGIGSGFFVSFLSVLPVTGSLKDFFSIAPYFPFAWVFVRLVSILMGEHLGAMVREAAGKVFMPVSAFPLLVPEVLRGRLIVLDDLERRHDSLEMNEILGFVDEFREQYDCRFLLLLNTDYEAERAHAKKKKGVTSLCLDLLREKVIRENEIKLTILPERVIEVLEDGLLDETLQGFLRANRAYILDAFTVYNVSNVRVGHAVLYHAYPIMERVYEAFRRKDFRMYDGLKIEKQAFPVVVYMLLIYLKYVKSNIPYDQICFYEYENNSSMKDPVISGFSEKTPNAVLSFLREILCHYVKTGHLNTAEDYFKTEKYFIAYCADEEFSVFTKPFTDWNGDAHKMNNVYDTLLHNARHVEHGVVCRFYHNHGFGEKTEHKDDEKLNGFFEKWTHDVSVEKIYMAIESLVFQEERGALLDKLRQIQAERGGMDVDGAISKTAYKIDAFVLNKDKYSRVHYPTYMSPYKIFEKEALTYVEVYTGKNTQNIEIDFLTKVFLKTRSLDVLFFVFNLYFEYVQDMQSPPPPSLDKLILALQNMVNIPVHEQEKWGGDSRVWKKMTDIIRDKMKDKRLQPLLAANREQALAASS